MYNDKYEYYTNKEELKKRILTIAERNCKNKKRTYLYAHSALYDSIGIFKNELIDGSIKIIKENMLIASKEDTKLVIIDTMNFSNKSLKEIGEIIGLQKLEMPGNPKTIEEIIPYNKRDLEVLKAFIEYIENTLAELGIKPRALWTTPQIAMNAFLSKMSKEKKAYKILEIKGRQGTNVIHTKHDEFIRKAYRLGRTQAYQTGHHQNITFIDQNRQFPFALANMKVPNLRQERRLKKPLLYIKKEDFLTKYVGVCHAKLTILKNINIGVLPIYVEGYEGYYPTQGTIKGYWTIDEIRTAINEGYELNEIYEAVYYPICEYNPFTKYMRDLYEIERKDPKKKFLIKMLMNGLIGKFGQKITDNETIISNREEMHRMNAEGYKVKAEIGNKFYYTKKLRERIPTYGNVMIALQCTATARINMYKWLKTINYEDLIYTDTDSLMIKNWNKYQKLIPISNEMGDFKIEKNPQGQLIINKECTIVKEKIYDIDGITKMSGLERKQRNKQNVELLLAGGELENDKMITINESLLLGKPELAGTFQKTNYTINKGAKNTILARKNYEQE